MSAPSRRGSIIGSDTLSKIINTPLEEQRKMLRRYSWLPDVFRIEGSIITRIVGPVLTVTVFAALVAALQLEVGVNLQLSNNVVPLLSVVVGLILVFRNSTSYDRYYEGRKDFASMTSHTRNLSRLVWVNVAAPVAVGATPTAKPSRKAIEKTTKLKLRAMKLIMAYPFSVMHHLREINGVEQPEVEALLDRQLKDRARAIEKALKRGKSPDAGYGTVLDEVSPEERTDVPANGEDKGRLKSRRITNNSTADQTTHLLSDSQDDVRLDMPDNDSQALPNVPLIVAHEINRMIYKFKRAGMLDVVGPAGTNAMTGLVQSMVDMLTAMERVRNTPIPASYGIHLKQCVTLYLFALPFILVNEMGYNLIPIVTVVAFTLMGIEGIANEIEMPFGKDKSDLPLETYCNEVKQDIEYLIAYLPQGDDEDGYMRDMPQDDEDDAVTF